MKFSQATWRTRTSCFLSAQDPHVPSGLCASWHRPGSPRDSTLTKDHFAWRMLCVLHFHSHLSLVDESTASFPKWNSGKSKNTYILESMLNKHSSKRHIQLILWTGTADMTTKVEHFTEYMSPNKDWFLLSFIWKKFHWDGLKNSTRSMQPVETLGWSAKTALEIN